MTIPPEEENNGKIRQEKREKRRAARASRMAQHGKKLAYHDAALKRAREGKKE